MTHGSSGKRVLASRIGRRMVMLFAGCALLPLIVFTALAVTSATRQMRVDLQMSLHDAAKTAGMGLAARLGRIDGDLELIEQFQRLHPEPAASLPEALRTHVLERNSAVWSERDGIRRLLGGGADDLDGPVERDARAHLASGKPLLSVGHGGELSMLRQLADGSLLGARVRSAWFWDAEELRAPGADVAVFDGRWRPLFHSFPGHPDFAPLRVVVPQQARGESLSTWQPGGEPHLLCAWNAFLRPQYGVDLWIVQSRAEAEALAVSRDFLWWFVAAAAVTLGLVLAASLVQMRRTLLPIVTLCGATRRLAAGDLAVRVGFAAGDEFGELGAAFDDMAARLQENVAQRECTERELIASRDQALAAAHAKAAFVTNVSHELRTPMTEVLGAVEILAQLGDIDPAARVEFTQIAFHGAQRLARLVDEVLALDAAAPLQRTAVAIGATVAAAVATFGPERRGRVRCEVPSGLPHVEGDADRLRDTWVRLLDNALKFSQGEVVVRANVCDDALIVEFVDHGVGIAAADRARIFEPFAQVGRDQLTDKASGTGLGLTLAKSTVERHGGRIEMDSVVGSGSTFRVVLPVRVPVGVA